jgi:hypothetical protein
MASVFLCFQTGFMASTESMIILVLCILLLRSLVLYTPASACSEEVQCQSVLNLSTELSNIYSS